MTLPFDNDTSAIVRNLANRSIQADKRRNMFIIVTIALAACLMMSIALYSFGSTHEMTAWMRDRYLAAIGRFDMGLLPELKEDEAIERIGVIANVTTLRSGKSTINVVYQDSENLELASVELLDGRWPEQKNEITAPASYLKKPGKEAAC